MSHIQFQPVTTPRGSSLRLEVPPKTSPCALSLSQYWHILGDNDYSTGPGMSPNMSRNQSLTHLVSSCSGRILVWYFPEKSDFRMHHQVCWSCQKHWHLPGGLKWSQRGVQTGIGTSGVSQQLERSPSPNAPTLDSSSSHKWQIHQNRVLNWTSGGLASHHTLTFQKLSRPLK